MLAGSIEADDSLQSEITSGDLPTCSASVVFTKLNEVIACDVGELFVSTKYRISIGLENKSESTFEASDISATCGCLVGLTESVEIKNGDSGNVLMVFDVPAMSGPFEKIATLKGVHGDTLRISVVGRGVSRVRFQNSNLIVSGASAVPTDLYLDVQSMFGDDLSELDWSAECGFECGVRCRRLTDGEYPKFRLDLDVGLKVEDVKDPSTPLFLTARRKNGLVYSRHDFQIFFSFIVSTSPRRVVLKRKDDEWHGVVIVRKAGFLEEGIDSLEAELNVLSEGNAHNPTKANATIKRAKNGSFLVNFRILDSETQYSAAKSECRLFLDQQLSVPLLFQ